MSCICICHLDQDGYSSAALVALNEPNTYIIPINYGWELPKEKLRKGDRVYVVDFTFSIEDMQYLEDNYELIWIDHHQDICLATEAILGTDIKGLRQYDKSGVELTWEYFHPLEQAPRAVALIGAYDLWIHDRYPFIVEFQRGLQEIDTFPIGLGKINLWGRIFTEDAFVDEIIVTGAKAFTKEKKDNATKCRYMCDIVDFDGYRTLIANMPFTDSYMFDSVADPSTHDLLASYYYYSKRGIKYWKFSVRPVAGKDIDVGALAAKFPGGGGHRNAAGWSVEYLSDIPFLNNVVRPE